MQPVIQDAWSVIVPYLQGVIGFVVGSIVSPIVTFSVQKWLKRPKIHVKLTRVHARFENVFRSGYFETSLAEVQQNENALGASGLGHFLKRYVELELTLEDSQNVTVAALIIRSSEGVQEFLEILSPCDGAFAPVVRPVLDERVSRVFYLDETRITAPVDTIQSVAVRDTSGAIHKSKRINNIADLDARLEPNPMTEALLSLNHEPVYELKHSATWLNFGIYCDNMGWHIGARITPQNGTSYQPAFDESEAAACSSFLKQLPGCSNLSFLTINDGVLFANSDMTEDRKAFYAATRAIHVADSGIIELCFRPPENDDLEGLYSVLAVTLAAATYLNRTRMTWPKQTLHVGYAGAKDRGLTYLAEPWGDKSDTVDVSRLDFSVQLAQLVTDLLRDGRGPLRDRIEVAESLADYWSRTFPRGLLGLPERPSRLTS
jgi:hypothetical protein